MAGKKYDLSLFFIGLLLTPSARRDRKGHDKKLNFDILTLSWRDLEERFQLGSWWIPVEVKAAGQDHFKRTGCGPKEVFR